MIDLNPIDELARRLSSLVPPGLRESREDDPTPPSGVIPERWPNRASPRLTLHESVGDSPVARPFPIRSQAPGLLEV